jgi:hypothetical protein
MRISTGKKQISGMKFKIDSARQMLDQTHASSFSCRDVKHKATGAGLNDDHGGSSSCPPKPAIKLVNGYPEDNRTSVWANVGHLRLEQLSNQ